MASTFTRLYRYAKAVGAEAKENYTTEALRACITTDARPFVLALRRAGIFDVAADANLSVQTQLAVKGAGQIDLVVTIAAEPRPFWFELKVDAGESGDQVSNYEAFIASLAEPNRPRLVVLGPEPLRDGLPWLSWQHLREAIVESRTASPYWHDFKTYLEEIGMADSHDERVSDSEVRALRSARRLLGKASRILTPFAQAASKAWPGSLWPLTEAKVVDAVASSFVSHGTLSIGNATNLRANVSAGMYHEPLTEDAWLGLWIWCRPNRVRERRAILDIVECRSWADDWFRDGAEWELFGAYRQLVSFESHAAATAWLTSCLVQLRDAGMLDLLPKLKAEA